jgi:enoyl-CoA hydratase/carnithine racemase
MLRLEHDGSIATLLIDRPEKRNAFNQAMWEALPGLVEAASDDPATRVIVLRSAADGMFCAGADISELLAKKDDAAWRGANQAAINRAQHVLARAAKPTIAFIDGDCVGGGTGLALACDIRIATAQSRIGITPANLGLVYPLHDTKLLVDLVGPGQAKRMLFGAELLPAKEAQRIGLVEMIAEAPDVLAELWASKSAHSLLEIKQFVRLILDGQIDDDDATRTVFAQAFEGADFVEGTRAFVAKRKADFR